MYITCKKKKLSEHAALKIDLFNKDESLQVGELKWLFLVSMTFKTLQLVHLIPLQISFMDLMRKNEITCFFISQWIFQFWTY